VRNDVLEATGRKQEPYVYGSLPPESFYFMQRKMHVAPSLCRCNSVLP